MSARKYLRYRRLLKAVGDRLLADYIRKLGLREYEKLLLEAKRCGYKLMSLSAFYDMLIMNQPTKDSVRIFLNRHDVDADLKTARKMFQIEKKLGVTSTFYFRLSTLDIDFMKEIYDYGSEVGYHFEEMATFAKKHHTKDKMEFEPHLEEIQESFLTNLHRIESSLGFKIRSVASHGDFANRTLECTNNEIINESLKKGAGIDFEAYELVPRFSKYLSDAPYPKFWRRGSPFTSMEEGAQIVCLLTHPYNWGRNFWARSRANFERVIEGLVWKLSS